MTGPDRHTKGSNVPADEPYQGTVGRTFEESTPWWPELDHGPAGAPNVVVVLLDDVGYAQYGCYGSDIATPTFDRLAAGGLRYSNFHTTSLCSPTRAALLTGRNHHTNGMGRIVEFASGFPGYDARIPKTNGFISAMLRAEGYATFALGKWHIAPAGEMTPGGPRDRWPLGQGFERFYGFLWGETDQYHPDLVHDNHQIDPPRTPEEGYHLTEDLADHAIEFLKDLRAVSDRPFFTYFAPGACHSPHQAPLDYIDRYRGAFDQGWDAWRDEVFARQTASGLLPEGTALSERPPWVPAWDTLSADERRLYARMMEVYAGFLDPHRRPGGAGHRLHRRAGRAGQHDRAGHERQRRQLRRRAQGLVQRDVLLQLRARVARGEPRPHRPAGRARRPQPLPVGVGVGRELPAAAVEARDLRGGCHRPAHRPLAGAAWRRRARPGTSTCTPSTCCPRCSTSSG